jgi:hypothetical protein
VLACTKARNAAAGFECVAYAAPCTIAQVPGRPAPKKRSRSAPIET